MAGLFGSGSTAAAPVVRMPSLSDSNLREAKTNEMANLKKRQGRQSTILSDSLSKNANGSVGAVGA